MGKTRKNMGKEIEGVIIPVPPLSSEMDGFSTRNLKYMKQFAETWPQLKIGQQPVAQLQWRSILTLMSRIKDNKTREIYADWQNQLTEAVPDNLKSSLPSVEEIEREIDFMESSIESGAAERGDDA